jgi:hypothetical protein
VCERERGFENVIVSRNTLRAQRDGHKAADSDDHTWELRGANEEMQSIDDMTRIGSMIMLGGSM